MTQPLSTPSVRVVVIGAGQAGLSAAYHLLRMGFRPFDDVVVLDANDRPGGAWQHRWPSASTIGGNRAGLAAARELRRTLAQDAAA